MRFSFPAGVFEIEGVIINNEYIPFDFDFSTVYPSQSDLVHNIIYDAAGFIDFPFEREINEQENIYVVVSGEPQDQVDEYLFSGSIYTEIKKKKLTLLDENHLTIKATQQPHDPNNIESDAYSPCFDDEIEYLVNFQNLGNGYAKHVEVEVFIDGLYLNAFSLDNIETSHPGSLSPTVSIEENKIKFKYEFIDLPGVLQTIPNPFPYNSTMGWIKFSLNLHDCLVEDPNGIVDLITTGQIIFYGQGGFIQHTPMNQLIQKACHSPCPTMSMQEDNTLFENKNIKVGDSQDEVSFSIEGYPTLVQDEFFIKTSTLSTESPLLINLLSLNGEVLFSKNIITKNMDTFEDNIDVSHLPSGIYFLQAVYNQQSHFLKLIKE